MKIVSFASILASFGSASSLEVENRPDIIKLKDTRVEFQEGRQAFDISGNSLEKNAGFKNVEVVVSDTEGSCPQGFRPLSQSECAEEYSDLSYDVGNGINAMSGKHAMWWVHGCLENTFGNKFWNAASGGPHGFPVCTPSTAGEVHDTHDKDKFTCDKTKRFVPGVPYKQWTSRTTGDGEAARTLCHDHWTAEEKKYGWWFQYYGDGHFNCARFTESVGSPSSTWEDTQGRPEEVCVPKHILPFDKDHVQIKPEFNIFEKKKPGLSLFGGMCDPKQCGEWDCERFCFCFKMFPWFDTLFDRNGWSDEYCPADEDTCECNPIEVQPEDLPTNIIDELKRDPLLPIDKLGPIWNPPQLFFDVIKPRIICGDWLPGPEDLQDMINELTHAYERMEGRIMNKDMIFDATFMKEYHFVAPMLTFLKHLRNTQSLQLAVDMTKTEMSQHLFTHDEIPQSERDYYMNAIFICPIGK